MRTVVYPEIVAYTGTEDELIELTPPFESANAIDTFGFAMYCLFTDPVGGVLMPDMLPVFVATIPSENDVPGPAIDVIAEYTTEVTLDPLVPLRKLVIDDAAFRYTHKINPLELTHVPDVSVSLVAILYTTRTLTPLVVPTSAYALVHPDGAVGLTDELLYAENAMRMSPAWCAGMLAMLVTPVAEDTYVKILLAPMSLVASSIMRPFRRSFRTPWCRLSTTRSRRSRWWVMWGRCRQPK